MPNTSATNEPTLRLFARHPGAQEAPAAEPFLDRVPVADLILAALPAQEGELAVDDRKEVDEARARVLDDPAGRVDGLDLLPHVGLEALLPLEQAGEVLLVGIGLGGPGLGEEAGDLDRGLQGIDG